MSNRSCELNPVSVVENVIDNSLIKTDNQRYTNALPIDLQCLTKV